MGAGSFPAAAGPAGFDPPVPGSSPALFRPIALRYEGSVSDWVIDQFGGYEGVTPNEQAVALGVLVFQGQIKSSPEVGNTLDQIQYLGGSNLGADVENRIKTANPIARLLSAGSISIDRIDHSTDGGKLAVAVYFRDLDVDPTRILRTPRN